MIRPSAPSADPRLPQDRPTVLLVAHPVNDRGGMERALAQLIRLASDRVAFHVMSVELQEDLRPLVRWTRVPAPLRPFPVLMSWFWLVTPLLAARVEADLVHTMGAITPVRADLVSVQFCHAAFQALPKVLGGERAGIHYRLNNALKRVLALQAERWCYRPSRTRRLAPASRGIRAELARFYPAVPSTVIPNAAEHERFRPDAAARARLRGAAALSDDAVVVLFLGGDWGRKGLAEAIDGVGAARRSGREVVLWVVGRGDVDSYRARARAVGDGDWCVFHGFTREPEHYLAAADVFISPTAYEAFPLAVLEAAATGLPVAATNVNGIAELIRDGHDGVIITRDASSIAAAIERLCDDSALRSRMGARARVSAGRFTWTAVARATVDAYSELRGVPSAS
jgi:UDP-glucose:(heptosyl)LPS alpha-1,3-glucosyltransferase